MALTILDHLTDAGTPGGRNEDRLGWNACAAFVLDGATSLAEAPLVATEGMTDPEWLAARAADALAERVTPSGDLRAIVRDLCAEAARDFETAAGADAPDYARPASGLQILRERGDAVDAFGLGDCRLFLLGAVGALMEASGMPEGHARGGEQAAARVALDRHGGLGGEAPITTRLPGALLALRTARARQNRPGGVWTLGVVPEAADHARLLSFTPTRPALALLATDGVADLIDLYARYDARGLVEAAARDGLAPLFEELRRIEREEDPEGALYARFKRSDDATAILLRLD